MLEDFISMSINMENLHYLASKSFILIIFLVTINDFRKPFIITISDIRIEGECNEQFSLTPAYKRRYSQKDFERYLHWLQACFCLLFVLRLALLFLNHIICKPSYYICASQCCSFASLTVSRP